MNWLTELHTVVGCKFQTKLIRSMCGIAVLCCSSAALAESSDQVSEFEGLAWIENQTEVLADTDLSFVSGKGAEALALDADGKLAIILWDEGSSDNRRGTSHDVNSRPAINLTIVHK